MKGGEHTRSAIVRLPGTNAMEDFFDVSLDLHCVADDSRFVILSPAWERTLGYSLATLKASAFFDFVHPDDQAATHAALAELAAQHVVIDFVNRYRHKDGSYRWLEWRAVPDGTRIYASARDVTDTKLAEAQIEQASRRWSTTFDAMHELVWLLDRHGNILQCNRPMADFLSLPLQQIVGRKCHELMHGAEAFCESCPYQEMLRTGESEKLEVNLRGRSYSVSADPVFDSEGELSGAVHVFEDITTFKDAERALAAQTEWLKSVNALAVELASAPPSTPLDQLLTDRLREMTGALMAGFSEYDSAGRALTPTAVTLAPGILEKVARPLLRRLKAASLPVTEELHAEMLREPVDVSPTLRGPFDGAGPRIVAATVRKLLGTDRFSALAYVVDGELYGTSLLALKTGSPDLPRAFLESFARLGAVALRRRHVEEQLRESQERLEHTLSASSAMLYIRSTTGTRDAIYVSPNIERLTGYSPQEWLGEPQFWYSHIHPDDRERIVSDVASGLMDDRQLYEYRWLHKNGEYRWMHDDARLVRAADGSPQRVIGVWLDMNERVEERLRREALLQSEAARAALMLDIYENAPALTEIALHEYVLERAVDLTESKIGFLHRVTADQMEIVSSAWSRAAVASRETDSQSHLPIAEPGNWVDCVRLGHPVISNDRAESPDGKGLPDGHAPLRRLLTVPFRENDATTFVIGVANKTEEYDERDVVHIQLVAGELHKILDRRRAEEQIRDLNASLERRVRERTRELAAANHELQEFVYSVSHDLRSPLRAVDGFSLTVLEDYGDVIDAQGRSDLKRVRAAAQRMGELIDALLSLSRLGRREVDLRRVDLSAIARRVIGELREADPERQIDVVIEDDLAAEGDKALLDIVVENLLGNAWKFTAKRPSAHIEVGSIQRDGQQVFFVRDDGAGFDPAYLDQLFTPFQRLHTTEQFPGAGIGLATVARVLDRLGGRWWAEGEVDCGATFFFTLSGSDAQPPLPLQ